MFDRRLLMALAANSMAGNFIDMSNGGGAGLINFIVFPVYNSDGTHIKQYKTPELYNSLYKFFNNFENIRFAYPVAYISQAEHDGSDMVFINQFEYGIRTYYVPEIDGEIDIYIGNDRMDISFSAHDHSGSSSVFSIKYLVNTKEIYTIVS